MRIRDQLVQLAELGVTDQNIKELLTKQRQLSQKAKETQAKTETLLEEGRSLEVKNNDLMTQKRKLDSELQTEKANLRKWETRAEKIRGDREYAALISEIGSLKKNIFHIENKALEVMQEQEDLDRKWGDVKKSSFKLQKRLEEEWSFVKDDLIQIENQIADCASARLKLMEKMPVALLKRYEQIAAKRAGLGVSLVKNQVCQACSRMLPPELFLRVAKCEILEQCPSCQRILVTEEMSYTSVAHK
jgi:uncharacterized protein